MDYLVVKIDVDAPFKDILMAELGEQGFDSFSDEEDLVGYITPEAFSESNMNELKQQYTELFDFSWSVTQAEKKNWNAEWEKNYTFFEITDQCVIRASHYQVEKEYPIEIVIDPRMSFGTGHHETTALVVEFMLKMHLNKATVLDAGCGTSILAILASKLGAARIDAYDIDEWAVSNSNDNLLLNSCENINVKQGGAESVEQNVGEYDLVVANINKNILLDQMNELTSFVKKEGHLVLSGFYVSDVEDMIDEVGSKGFVHLETESKNKWASLKFAKKGKE